jgi:branched-chain amino acid transport system substrate-binding protein
MSNQHNKGISRRSLIKGAGAAAGLAAAGSILPSRFAMAAAHGKMAPIKIGILLPYSGTYAMLGNSITDAMKLRIAAAGDMLGGRPVEYVAIDSEMSVPKAPQNTSKLVDKDQVDILVGPVHSGIAAAMAKIVGKRKQPIMIVPNAGSNAVPARSAQPTSSVPRSPTGSRPTRAAPRWRKTGTRPA